MKTHIYLCAAILGLTGCAQHDISTGIPGRYFISTSPSGMIYEVDSCTGQVWFANRAARKWEVVMPEQP